MAEAMPSLSSEGSVKNLVTQTFRSLHWAFVSHWRNDSSKFLLTQNSKAIMQFLWSIVIFVLRKSAQELFGNFPLCSAHLCLCQSNLTNANMRR